MSEKIPQNSLDSMEGVPTPDASAEVQPEKQQTPEQLRESRRMEIIKEIEGKWAQKNGPMERKLTEREIEEAKYHAERLGSGKWDGRTTALTEKATNFYFGFGGGLSVPKQAEQLLLERYPEYRVSVEKATPKNEGAAESVPSLSKESEAEPVAIEYQRGEKSGEQSIKHDSQLIDLNGSEADIERTKEARREQNRVALEKARAELGIGIQAEAKSDTNEPVAPETETRGQETIDGNTFAEDALGAMNGYSRGGYVRTADARYGLEKLAKSLEEAGEHEKADVYRGHIDEVLAAISRSRRSEGVHTSSIRRELGALTEKWKEQEQERAKELTLENIRKGIEKGEPMSVKVRRSSGHSEQGWKAEGVNEEKGEVLVRTSQIPGMPMSKTVSFKDLQEWNK